MSKKLHILSINMGKHPFPMVALLETTDADIILMQEPPGSHWFLPPPTPTQMGAKSGEQTHTQPGMLSPSLPYPS